MERRLVEGGSGTSSWKKFFAVRFTLQEVYNWREEEVFGEKEGFSLQPGRKR